MEYLLPEDIIEPGITPEVFTKVRTLGIAHLKAQQFGVVLEAVRFMFLHRKTA